MEKAVLISIKRIWCELIKRKEKTIEVRTTFPKVNFPFTCYIYETLENNGAVAVIGEFTCDKIDKYSIHEDEFGFLNYDISNDNLQKTCLRPVDLLNYGYSNESDSFRTLYGWHISNLIIYKHPKALCEFLVPGECSGEHCNNCIWFERGDNCYIDDDCELPSIENTVVKPIFRAPQSWQYVTILPSNEGIDE